MTELEKQLWQQMMTNQLSEPEQEWPSGFGKCRFDFAWPEIRLAVEVEGGTWTKGRHVRGVGYANDCKKYNAAQLDGWLVIRVTSDMIQTGCAIKTIKQAYERAVARMFAE